MVICPGLCAIGIGQDIERRGLRWRRQLLRTAEGAIELERRFELGHGKRVDDGHLRPHVGFEIAAPQQPQDFREIAGAFRRPNITRNRGDGRHLHLPRAAQHHHQRAAIVAEEAAIGIEDDFIGGWRSRGEQQKR